MWGGLLHEGGGDDSLLRTNSTRNADEGRGGSRIPKLCEVEWILNAVQNQFLGGDGDQILKNIDEIIHLWMALELSR